MKLIIANNLYTKGELRVSDLNDAKIISFDALLNMDELEICKYSKIDIRIVDSIEEREKLSSIIFFLKYINYKGKISLRLYDAGNINEKVSCELNVYKKPKEIKISVANISSLKNLSSKYENVIEHACSMVENSVFKSIDGKLPEGMCYSAWMNLEIFVFVLSVGGYNIFDGWMKNPYSAMISCNDGFRPVSFLIESIFE